MRKIIIISFLLVSTILFGQQAQRQVFLDYDVSKSSTSKSNNDYSTVYICNGNYATKYHRHKNCRGLSNCKGGVNSTTKGTAKEKGRSACGICY